MSKQPPAKRHAIVMAFWANATFHDRVLALNALGYSNYVSKEYADKEFDLLPPDVSTKLLGSAK